MENRQIVKTTKHGWVDLSNLPRTKNGRVDWQNSEGCIIPFKYDDVTSLCVINKFLHNKRLDISIDNYAEHYIMDYNNLSHGTFGYVLKKLSTSFLFNIGDVINKSLLITSQYRDVGLRKYNYTCIEDGHIGSISEGDAIRGKGCPACSGRVAIIGKTDIATTHPHIANLFWNNADVYKYSAFSKAKIDFRCPRCGTKINSAIYNVTLFGLSCKKCGDGVSYPEKLVYNFLQQIVELHSDTEKLYNFIPQHTFDWSKNIWHENEKLRGNKIYDFYLPTENPICIECQGEQHYSNTFSRIGNKARTLLEEQENDKLKMDIAIQNGIQLDCYIQLDCRQSTLEYIKNSIMSSNLPKLLSFTESQIDWAECGRFAMSSRMIEACDLWNSGIRSTSKIGTVMQMNRSTIRKYLHRGEELGMIQDSPRYIKNGTMQQ